MAIVQVNLNQNQIISDYVYNYIMNNVDISGSGFVVSGKTQFVTYNNLVYIPPANAVSLELLTDGVYFIPVGLTDFDEMSIEQVTLSSFIDVSQNKTVFLFSYYQKIANIKINYD